MNITLQEKLDVNYRRALDVGRQQLIKVCRVCMNGVSISDKLVGLSNTAKKRLGFSRDALVRIEAGCELKGMDIPLLCVVIDAFGEDDVSPSLKKLILQLKKKRNLHAHDPCPSLTKQELTDELAEIHTVSTSIIEELKITCSPGASNLLDHDIAEIGLQLSKLEISLEVDHEAMAVADMLALMDRMKREAMAILKKDETAKSDIRIENSTTGAVNHSGVQLNSGGGKISYQN